MDPQGVLYLGDGAWGVTPRKPAKRWYLEKAAQTNCFWLVSLTQESSFEAFDGDGKSIDAVSIKRLVRVSSGS